VAETYSAERLEADDAKTIKLRPHLLAIVALSLSVWSTARLSNRGHWPGAIGRGTDYGIICF